jgi:UDP-GlcNAc:undecaprenyl-phosphate/decaprenyl-phosphate GlcNAc-1-phosphate transferase
MITALTDTSALLVFTSLPAPLWVHLVLGFLMAFSIAYLAIPMIVWADRRNNLLSVPNGRTSHKLPTPVFGGVAIFTGFIISTITFAGSYFDPKFIYCFAGLVIIFIVGAKDDLTHSKPRKKLLGQVIATVYISVLADIRISNLHDFMNIGPIPYLASIVLSVFVFIVIINSFNLIDGIDGLASGVGIIIAFLLGVWFYRTDNYLYTVVSFSLVGSLVAFFYFNVFSKKHKIFLGDTGSEIVGFILGLILVRFLQLEAIEEGPAVMESTPALAISLFIIPLFDTLRVFSIRISQGKSPFKADQQHIHHRLLELGFNHLQSTIILLSVNVANIVICYLIRDLGTYILIVLQIGLCLLISQILKLQVRKSVLKKSGIY